jgi:hypothetical protein
MFFENIIAFCVKILNDTHFKLEGVSINIYIERDIHLYMVPKPPLNILTLKKDYNAFFTKRENFC